MKRQSDAPLDDITVLDLTWALSGPIATLLLGGLGACVIKIENPTSGDPCRDNAPYLGPEGTKLVRDREDDFSISALNRLRNKLGVTLNLKHSLAGEVLADLARNADLFVENFSPGTLSRLGLGYDFIRSVNPRIVYCSITGFGSDARPGSQKAFDTVIQALSGVMNVSGEEGDPPVRIGLPLGDLTAPLFAVIGLLAALHQARRTGVGQHVDVSMLGALTALVASEPYQAMKRCGATVRTGPTFQRLCPFGVYRARDGHVAICAHTDGFAHALFKVMERADLVLDERFRTRDGRVKHYRETDALVGEWTGSVPTSEIVRKLHAAGIPAAEVRDPDVAVRDPGVLGRNEAVLLSHPKYGAVDEIYGMGLPIKFSGATADFDQPPPYPGEHNQAVYGGLLGYSADRIEELRARGVI